MTTQNIRHLRCGAERWASLLFALLVAFGAKAAQAEQFVLFDVSYTHDSMTTRDSHYELKPSMQTPSNWQAPIDYASGTAYLQLEVMTKPSNVGTKFQVCLIGAPSYACTSQSPTYTTTGTVKWTSPFKGFYQYANVDWSKGIKNITAILKDTQNGKPAPENVGATTAAQYMPTKVRLVMTVVSAGGTYVPPDMQNPDGGATPSLDAGMARDAGAGGSNAGGLSGGTGGTASGGSGGASSTTGGSGGAARGGGAGEGGAAGMEPGGQGDGNDDGTTSKSGCAFAAQSHGDVGTMTLAFVTMCLASCVCRRRRG